MNDLARDFESVGLELRPWERREDIFAMDIRGDAFLVCEGRGNEVRVVARDRDMQQVVLLVREPRRTFNVAIRPEDRMPRDRVLGQDRRPGFIVVERTTPGKRQLLAGLDERGHPFVAELRRTASSVKDAHEALKPPGVAGREVRGKGKNYRRGKSDGKITRQGEWFFTEIPVGQRPEPRPESVERNAAIRLTANERAARGGRRGKPHVAQELVDFGGGAIYVRGSVRHADHGALHFKNWVRVVRNNEAVQPRGVSWVD